MEKGKELVLQSVEEERIGDIKESEKFCLVRCRPRIVRVGVKQEERGREFREE